MPTTTVTVASTSGLHARPAAAFTRAAATSGATVTLSTAAGNSANGASLLSILALGINHNDQVTLSVTGTDEDRILTELAQLIGSDLDA